MLKVNKNETVISQVCKSHVAKIGENMRSFSYGRCVDESVIFGDKGRLEEMDPAASNWTEAMNQFAIVFGNRFTGG